jgi:2,3-bisphosphoglycerate-dependent phosphoglycerate mutase
MTTTRLVLTRHGETNWHRDNRYAGADSDVDLTQSGRLQAKRLAAWSRAQRPDAVVSSPVRRAVETARPSAEAVGLQLEIVDDLREVSFGIADGHTLAELAERDAEMVRRFRADPVRHHFPGAESPHVAAKRGAQALRGLAEQHPGSSVLVVAHNTVLRLALCVLLDLPISRYRQLFPRLDNGAITELVLPAGSAALAALRSFNVPVEARLSNHPTEQELT